MSGTRLDKAENGGKDWSRGKKGKLDGRNAQASAKLGEEEWRNGPLLGRKRHLFPPSGVDGARIVGLLLTRILLTRNRNWNVFHVVRINYTAH